MRLLRTKDLRFEEYFGKPTPPYAILSHTWYPDHEEVTYREMCVGKGTKKLGYDKVRKCGQIAAGNGLKYFWVDTCCIDKSNNVELTESIRSMFEWYRKARVCYAYLSDVSALSFRPTVSCFKAIKWFTRGWTLQEFLAPADVQFISKEWKYLGSKAGNLTRVIEEFTGIPKAVLEGVALTMFSVAERMSWAVGRRTTRVEDIAYSLMGIFDVDIPPLYGEKGNAFIRLQEEIMRRTDDQSIFAWKEPDPSFPKSQSLGLLARSPDCFAQSKGILPSNEIPPPRNLNRGDTDRFFLSNKGLVINLFLVRVPGADEVYRASLECCFSNSVSSSPSIYLKRLKHAQTYYTRICGAKMDILGSQEKAGGAYERVYVQQYQEQPDVWKPEVTDQILFRFSPHLWKHTTPTSVSISVEPSDAWDPQTRIFACPGRFGKQGIVLLKEKADIYAVNFGLDKRQRPWVRMLRCGTSDSSWASYQPDGTEQTTSQIVCDEREHKIVFSVSVNSNMGGVWPVQMRSEIKYKV